MIEKKGIAILIIGFFCAFILTWITWVISANDFAANVVFIIVILVAIWIAKPTIYRTKHVVNKTTTEQEQIDVLQKRIRKLEEEKLKSQNDSSQDKNHQGTENS